MKLGGADFRGELRGTGESNYTIVQEGRCREGGKDDVDRFNHGFWRVQRGVY